MAAAPGGTSGDDASGAGAPALDGCHGSSRQAYQNSNSVDTTIMTSMLTDECSRYWRGKCSASASALFERETRANVELVIATNA